MESQDDEKPSYETLERIVCAVRMFWESRRTALQYVLTSLAWPDPFSRRALSIRDDKRPLSGSPYRFVLGPSIVVPGVDLL